MKLRSRTAVAGVVLSMVGWIGLISTGCGSGAGGPISNCGLDSFTPSYSRNVNALLTWPSFPVTVFFVRDANYTVNRQNIALAGFDQWVDATGGALDYQVVNSSANADITVQFDPSTSNGMTELHFSGLQMISADMTIGLRNLDAADVQCVAAHEFGHALGINGHSDDSDDLMSPVHVVGDVCPITTRDLNTMKTAYCDVFTRSARRSKAPNGPIQTVRIE